MQDTGYRIQDIGYRIQDTVYSIQDIGESKAYEGLGYRQITQFTTRESS